MTDPLDYNAARARRDREQAAAKADKYIAKDGSAPKDIDDDRLTEISKLSPVRSATIRDAEADKLGIDVRFLDAERKERRKADGGSRTAERPHWTVEPSSAPVFGSELLARITKRIQKHVVMDDEPALTVALWIMFAWCHSAAVHSPILLVSSPEAECGKTTLLGIISLCTPRGMMFVQISPAALYRMIEKWHPTLVVDEADTAFKENNDLRAVVNAGWTRGAGVPRCNPKHERAGILRDVRPEGHRAQGSEDPRHHIVEVDRGGDAEEAASGERRRISTTSTTTTWPTSGLS